ncbi:hypothetical protein [Moritella sp. F3]|uniref:hypothetical protein n=1 Tax=Moritella sp. F3 TaxID=2718882 RepID=UPI0018E0DF59|nr:hypothetical protein [Moritella sp. F3]GIC77698.1 hypothetical protein FMO001_24250 [Moritella sp. F1]GIC82111.1 hypothetical protein FMO003_23920 [Moritella sp. F3]
MNALQLAEELNSIYFIIDKENEGKFCVSRTNVINLAKTFLSDSNNKESDLFFHFCEKYMDSEPDMLDQLDHGIDIFKSFDKMDAKSNYGKSIAADDFVNAFKIPEIGGNLKTYGELCLRLGIALCIYIVDVNSEFWKRAFDDGLTPIEATQKAHKEKQEELMAWYKTI